MAGQITATYTSHQAIYELHKLHWEDLVIKIG
jgi:hypothetical protein